MMIHHLPLPVGAILKEAGGDRFEIGPFLGWGGYGFVHRATDRQTGDDVVVKILRPDVIAAQPGAVEQFAREARAAQRIDHPNVARVRAYIDANASGIDIPYLVMDYVGGGDLHDFIDARSDALIDQGTLLTWMAQLTNGLDAIHQHLLHRDLKPKNVLIDGSTLKISDFGMAKYIEEATRTITAKGLGTAYYMAPETWRYERATPATDVYSLGVIFYQLATLRLPYVGRDATELRQAHLTTRIPRVSEERGDLDERLDGMIVKMMAKDPRDRYQSASDVSRMIAQIASEPLPSSADVVGHVVHAARRTFDSRQEERAAHASRAEGRMESIELINFQMREFADRLDRLVEVVNARLPEQPINVRKGVGDRFIGQGDARVYAYDHRTLVLGFFDLPSMIVHVDHVPIVAVGTLTLATWMREVVSSAGFTVGFPRPVAEPFARGLHILLVRAPEELYGRWKTCEVKENALYATSQRRLAREQVTFPTIEDVLGRVREMSILSTYDTSVHDFADDDFYHLLHQVVS